MNHIVGMHSQESSLVSAVKLHEVWIDSHLPMWRCAGLLSPHPSERLTKSATW